MNLTDWLAMGGHGLYVWGSLGMCCAAIGVELALLAQRRCVMRRDALASRQTDRMASRHQTSEPTTARSTEPRL